MPRPLSTDVDTRKEALCAVIEALNGLDEEAQRRVLETAAVFFEIWSQDVTEKMTPSVRPGGG